MDIISLAIVAFVIYTLFTAVKESAGRAPGRPGSQNPLPRMPRRMPPPVPPTQGMRRTQTQTQTQTGTAVPSQTRARTKDMPGDLWRDADTLWADPYKDKEVAEAEGREGVWGDEGRPVMDASPSSEGTMGVEGLQGAEGTAGREGTYGISTGIPGSSRGGGGPKDVSIPKGANAVMSGVGEKEIPVTLSQAQLVQGIIWAEVLGRPRALRRFRGPRA